MILRYPAYYEQFKCIAGACEDTCCAGWEIDIDDESYEYYQQVSGEFGDRLKENIKEYHLEDDIYESHGFRLKEEKRCPFLNQDNLCDMILELGEQSLCYVCAHTPRNYFEYDGAREISISPSCPEAARLMFSEKSSVQFIERETEEAFHLEESEEERRTAGLVRKVRDVSVFLLQRRKKFTERLGEFLIFLKNVQELWNQEKTEEILSFAEEVQRGLWDAFFTQKSSDRTFDTNEQKKLQYQGFCKRLEIFSELESIHKEWEETLEKLRSCFLGKDLEDKYLEELEKSSGKLEMFYEQLCVYYAFLMIPRALDDENFWGKAQFTAVSFLMVRDMVLENQTAEEFMRKVRFYAKEIEHSETNMELLEEEFLFEEIYQLDRLLYQI